MCESNPTFPNYLANTCITTTRYMVGGSRQHKPAAQTMCSQD